MDVLSVAAQGLRGNEASDGQCCLFGVAFILFAAHKPMPWELQRKRDLRKKQRGKIRDR
jgi:hypothetical protein